MDDGIGIYQKITNALELPDLRLSLFELSKGKFTSGSSQQAGDGVFFTSRMVDGFVIDAKTKRTTREVFERFTPDVSPIVGIGVTGTARAGPASAPPAAAATGRGPIAPDR